MKVKAFIYKPETKTLTISLTHHPPDSINDLHFALRDGKQVNLEMSINRDKRSLNANAYLWTLLTQIAEKLNSSKDEIYIEMLARYGQCTYIVCKPEAVDKIKQEWRTVKELGTFNLNGNIGIQLQCFYGSSTYNSKEFSVLLDGVVSECKELGIETLDDVELKQLIDNIR